MTSATRNLPVGAELAVAQHLEDLLISDRGQELLDWMVFEHGLRLGGEQGYVRAVRELAAWLAEQLVRGSDA